jgi:hypothetical protein
MGFLTLYANLSTLLWTGAFAWSLYQFIAKRRLDVIKELENTYLIVCYFVPLVIALVYWIVITADGADFGLNNPICMIQDAKWELAFGFYIPFVAVFIFNLYCYLKIVTVLTSDGASVGWALQFMVYPLILFLCTLFACVDRYLQAQGVNVPMLEYLHVFFIQLQGFLNFVVYGFNEGVRRQVIPYMKRIFCCSKSEEEMDFEEPVIKFDPHALDDISSSDKDSVKSFPDRSSPDSP